MVRHKLTLESFLELAKSNLANDYEFSVKIGNAQMAMYKDFKKMGYDDNEDVYELIKRHPKMILENYIIKFS